MPSVKYTDFLLTVARGDPMDLLVPIAKNGVPIDLTDWTDFEVFVKAHPTDTDTDALVDLKESDADGTVSVSDATGGIIAVSVPSHATQALENKARTLYMDVMATAASGTVYVIAHGKLKVTKKAGAAKPFAPTQIKGLHMWLRADQGLFQDAALTQGAVADGATVLGWKGRGAASHAFTNTNTGQRATKLASGQNDLPVVRGDGLATILNGPNWGTFVKAEEFTIFAVVRPFDQTLGGGDVLLWPPLLSDQDNSFAVAFGGTGSQAQVGVYNFDGLVDVEVIASLDQGFGSFYLIEARHGPEESDSSGVLSAGNTAQQLMEANAARTSFSLKNNSSVALYLDFTGVDAVIGHGVLVGATQTYSVTTNVPVESISIIGTITGQAWEATEGTGVTGIRVDDGQEETQVAGQNQNRAASKLLASPTYLFGNPDGRPHAQIDVAEVLTYTVHLDDPSKALLRGYLQQKWNIPNFTGEAQPT